VQGSGFKVEGIGCKVSAQPLAATQIKGVWVAASLIEKETDEHRTSNVQH
jgi:hypothetical protein